MADRLESPDPGVPPPAEAIHMAGASYLPATLAFGLMLVLVGLILTFVISAIGAIIVAVALFRWIGQARGEMSELPLEHR
jgi:hypothetical protein